MKKEQEHDLVGWDRAWPVFCKSLKDVHEAYPEWLALTRYLVGVIAPNHSAPVSTRGKVPQKKCSIVNSSTSKKGGVLFIPIFNRSYCLGVCQRLAEEVHRDAPEKAIHFLMPDGDLSGVDLHESWIQWHSKKLLRKFVFAPRMAVRAFQAWRMAVHALRADDKICRVMPLKFNRWRIHLAKFSLVYYWEVACAKRWLEKHGVKVIVTINDVVKPAAQFIAAGNQLDLETIVLQHGVPGPQGAPFMAKQAWIWGETSKKLLCQFGANPERLEIVGNLEIDASVYEDVSREGSEIQPKLLLLSQWVGAAAWGETAYEEFFLTAGRAAKMSKIDWTLLVRLHPSEGDDVKEMIKAKLSVENLDVEFTKRENSIEEDISESSFVCSVNSSAIMHAVVANRPCAFLLSERLERRFGPSLLLSQQMARNGEELMEMLNDAKPLKVSEREQIMANYKLANSLASRKLVMALSKGASVDVLSRRNENMNLG